jgi:NDP-sugar pyrophosphorylase family protein
MMRDHVVESVDAEYGDRLEVEYVEQDTMERLGHCIYQARSAFDADESMCIILSDMLFESDYADFLDTSRLLGDVDGSISIKSVEDPSRLKTA